MQRRELRTPRLAIRPIEPEHARLMWEAVQASLAELSHWFAWANPEYTFSHAVEYATRATTEWRSRAAFKFGVWDPAPGRFLGTLALLVTNASERRAEIGYWVRSDACGRGVCTEAARALLRAGFGEEGVHRVVLRAAVDNAASNVIAERLGFTFEGIARAEGLARGTWLDMNRWAILDTEFAALPEPKPDTRPV